MVEEYPIAGEHIISLTVIDRCPIGEHFRDTVRAPRMEWSRFPLRDFRHFAKHLARRGLVEPRVACGFADRLENADGPDACDVRRVLGNVITDAHMTLGAEVINLIEFQV